MQWFKLYIKIDIADGLWWYDTFFPRLFQLLQSVPIVENKNHSPLVYDTTIFCF